MAQDRRTPIASDGQSTLSRATWTAIYILYFLYRSVICYLGIAVVSSVTALGDFMRYLEGGVNYDFYDNEGSNEKFLNSTRFMDFIGESVFRATGGSVLLSVMVFQSLAYVGILYLLNHLRPGARAAALLLFFSPSFNLWTSLPAKETVMVAATAVILVAILRMAENRRPPIILATISVYLVAIMKPQFLAPIILIAWGVFASHWIKERTQAVAVALILSLAALILVLPALDAIIPERATSHFRDTGLGARSTRLEDFWTEPGDLLWKAPEGMVLAFWGPTLTEARTTVLHAFTLAESATIGLVVVYVTLLHILRLPLYNLLLSFSATFWLVFSNYPQGVYNPGTAIRYRSGWFVLFVFATVVILHPQFEARRRRLARPETPRRTELPESKPAESPAPTR